MTALQLAILPILDNHFKYDWSVQGIGFLRLYIRKLGRIHIWDSSLAYPGVSTIHTHPWDLESTLVTGSIANTLFEYDSQGEEYMRQRIVTGYNPEIVVEPVQVRLSQGTHFYWAGHTYKQKANEIHSTKALDSTVTVMQRSEIEGGQADVFWPVGTEWGTAKPREATLSEVERVVQGVLNKWYR